MKGKIHRFDNTNAEISDYEYNELIGFTEFQSYIFKNLNLKGQKVEDTDEIKNNNTNPTKNK